MARSESRTKVGIWNEADFRALTKDAQRGYWMLYSQPTISLCGVLALTPTRWATYAVDETLDGVLAAIRELEEHYFVVVDQVTEELWVRTFVHHDGVTRSPKTLLAAQSQIGMIASATIRKGVRAVFDRLANGGDAKALGDTPSGGIFDTVPDGVCGGVPDTLRGRARAVSVSSLQSPSPRAPDRNGDSGGITPEVVSEAARVVKLEPYEADFEILWTGYPRKVDRKGALRTYTATRRRGADPVELARAVANYALAVRGRAPDKVKHGKTFFGPDEPWVEYVTGVPAGDSPLAAAVANGSAHPEATW